ncbi:hypothetical protein AB0O82_10635 [Kitasatospora sp. NPDC088264]|uniref:hypothetical protein n=1 Tax=Kitasatospora sp. NPDC088264 TaxID=3155296 RepID=UPI00343249F3
MSAKPISEARLAAIRAMDLAVLFPESGAWDAATTSVVASLVPDLERVLHELLDEIDALDDELLEADAENDRLTSSLKRPRRRTAEAGVRVRPASGGRWKVLWREDGKRRSRTIGGSGNQADDRRDAEAFAAYVRSFLEVGR